MEKVQIKKINEVYCKIIAEPSIVMEMSQYFTFEVPGAKYTPAYRNKIWDGKIRLLNSMTCQLYFGLIDYVVEFCKTRNYEVEYLYDVSHEEFSVKEANDFITELNPVMTPRDYQMDAFIHAVRKRRSLLLSPTASGKSFIIYLLTRYYNARTLIIVPTTALVSQLASDFRDYGFGTDDSSSDELDGIHCVTGGVDKSSNKKITISTWQSIYKLPAKYFQSFDVVIGDEAHLFKAKSLVSILTKMENCKYRFGFTGTLDGTQTNKLVLEGLFGTVRKVTTTKELIDQNHLSSFSVKAIVLSYPDIVRKTLIKSEYQIELDYIVRLKERNRFICNLALSLKGNTLLMFQFVEKHGDILHQMLTVNPDRKIYYISGKVDGEERDSIRKIVETEKNAIIIASSGTMSTGVNIRNIHNIIFASPSKSRIKNLQTIGRGLRKSDNGAKTTLFDIADDLSYKNKKNTTLLHFMERIRIYNEESFSYKIYNVSLSVK